MAEGVLMPKAGITVESCIIGEWKKEVGDSVAVGEVLFTYETDKAEFECESTAAGTLLAKFYENGDEVPCLVNVCAVGNQGDDAESLRGGSAAPAPAAEQVPVVYPHRRRSRPTLTYSSSLAVSAPSPPNKKGLSPTCRESPHTA